MEEIYIYNGKEYTRQQIQGFATKAGAPSFDAYVSQFGIQKKESKKANGSDTYSYKGKDYSLEEVNRLATKAGAPSTEAYISQFGLKKKEAPVSGFGEKASEFGGAVGGLSDGSDLAATKEATPTKNWWGGTEVANEYKPEDVSVYNKNFRDLTGHEEFDLSAPQEATNILETDRAAKKKKDYEEKLFVKNRAIEEKELKPLYKNVHYGFDTKEQLADLYSKPYGKKVVSDIINNTVPELNPGILSGVAVDDKKWEEISFAIQAKNRKNFETQFIETEKQQDEVITGIEPGVYEKEVLNARGDTKEYVKIDVPAINSKDRASVGGAIKIFKDILSNGEKSYNGVDIAKTILPSLEFKLGQLNRDEKIGDDIGTEEFRTRIGLAIDKVESDYGINDPEYKVSDIEKNETQARLVQRGLEYYRYAEPNLFKNAKRTIEKVSQMSEFDYKRLLDKGQELENDKVMLKAANDQSFIGKETAFVPKLASLLKSRQSAVIGETLKKSPFRGNLEYSDKQIDWAIENTDWQAAGVAKPTKAAADIIKLNEGKWFYDEIPKSGLGHSLLAGVTEPLYAIARTAEDLTSDSYAEDYLRSKQLDRGTMGSQLVMDDKGQLSNVLPSDKGNMWFDITKGTGSFITQALLTRGIGSPFAATARAGFTAVPRAALGAETAINTVSNVAGTGISSYLQAYGDAYENTLQKTGDPVRAKIMGNIEGAIAFGTELFLIEANVGSKIFKNLSGDVSENIYKIVRSNLDPAEKIKQITGRLKTFVKNSGDVLIQENFEELSAVGLSRIAKAIVTPEVPEDISLLNEIGQTIHATSLSLAVPAVASGAAAVRNRFTKEVFNTASLNLAYTESTLKKQLMDGTATQDEYNQAISLLTTNRNNILLSPVSTIGGKTLNKDERKEYGFQQTVVQINEEKAKKFTDNGDEVQAKIYKDKAKEARDIQTKIVEGVAVNDVPKEGKVFTDFDNTLFKDGKLTPLGEDIKERVAAGEDISILTAREATPENIQFIKDQIGVDERDIVAGLTPEGKAGFLTAGSTFYDDNNDNLEAARKIAGVNVVDSKAPETTLLDRVQESGNDGIKKLYDTPEKIVELQSQSLTTPSNILQKLGGNEELTTDLIAKNGEKIIKDQIEVLTEEKNNVKTDDQRTEEIDNHLELLNKGLDKASKLITKGTPEEISQPIAGSGGVGGDGKLKITDNSKDVLDEVTDEKIGEKKYQDFSIDFEDGARAFGTIENDVANISGINAPKKEGSVTEPQRGTKTYERVLDKLKEKGVKTVNIVLQSADSQKAIDKLVEKGILTNPRNEIGSSGNERATTFDISQPKAETTTQEGNAEKVAELEAARDMAILREKADIGELEFIAEDNLPKEEVDVMRKGEVIGTKKVPNEKLRLQQKEISDKFDKLKDLLGCLTGKKGK